MARVLDQALLRLLRTRGHAPALEAGAVLLTRAGEHGACWLAISAAGTAADPPRRAGYVRTAKAVALAYLISQLVKHVVRRPRPVLAGLPPVVHTRTRRSFPSSHAATSFAAARALGAMFPPAPLYAAATAMALTRPYLGVHYPSDVVVGAAMGEATARALR